MSKSIYITGSLAYDHIMTFPGHFKDHILPDKIHILNVAFNIETLKVDLGGTAGNIAYNMALLNEKPIIHATAGQDFDRYQKKLTSIGLSTDSIKIIQDAHTAQAFITTDLSDNQITAFHPGAMNQAGEYSISSKPELAIVAPNKKEAMLKHARYFQQNAIPFIFDPGQAFNVLSADELKEAIQKSAALTVNDYEWQLWKNKTGLDESKTLKFTDAVVITLGEKGARLITKSADQTLPAATPKKVVDPTGCGDAFRAGLLYGLKNQFNSKKILAFANAVASFCVEEQGTQNHTFSLASVEERAALFSA